MNSQTLARGLAYFSIGLGLAELLAPRKVARLIGVSEDNETLFRALGLREIGSGLGIIQGNPAVFLWSRVGGDIIDLSLLGNALRSERSNRDRVLGAMAAVAGVTVLDALAASRFSMNPGQPDWRVQRLDRGGMARQDPVSLRQFSDRMMQEHQSGHLRDFERNSQRRRRESDYASPASAGVEAEAHPFEAGD